MSDLRPRSTEEVEIVRKMSDAVGKQVARDLRHLHADTDAEEKENTTFFISIYLYIYICSLLLFFMDLLAIYLFPCFVGIGGWIYIYVYNM